MSCSSSNSFTRSMGHRRNRLNGPERWRQLALRGKNAAGNRGKRKEGLGTAFAAERRAMGTLPIRRVSLVFFPASSIAATKCSLCLLGSTFANVYACADHVSTFDSDPLYDIPCFSCGAGTACVSPAFAARRSLDASVSAGAAMGSGSALSTGSFVDSGAVVGTGTATAVGVRAAGGAVRTVGTGVVAIVDG